MFHSQLFLERHSKFHGSSHHQPDNIYIYSIVSYIMVLIVSYTTLLCSSHHQLEVTNITSPRFPSDMNHKTQAYIIIYHHMGVSENRENPIFQWFSWSLSLWKMAISLGRLTQHFQTNPYIYIYYPSIKSMKNPIVFHHITMFPTRNPIVQWLAHHSPNESHRSGLWPALAARCRKLSLPRAKLFMADLRDILHVA
jgi:hypothetical protein